MSELYQNDFSSLARHLAEYLYYPDNTTDQLVECIREEEDLPRTFTAAELELEFELQYGMDIASFRDSLESGQWIVDLIEDFKESLIQQPHQEPRRIFTTLYISKYNAYFNTPMYLKWTDFQNRFRKKEGCGVSAYRLSQYKSRHSGATTLDNILGRLKIALDTQCNDAKDMRRLEHEYYLQAKRLGMKTTDGKNLREGLFRQEFIGFVGKDYHNYLKMYSIDQSADRAKRKAAEARRVERERKKDERLLAKYRKQQADRRKHSWPMMLQWDYQRRLNVQKVLLLVISERALRNKYPGLNKHVPRRISVFTPVINPPVFYVDVDLVKRWHSERRNNPWN